MAEMKALMPAAAALVECYGGVRPRGLAERVRVADLIAGDHVLDTAVSISRVVVNEHRSSRLTAAVLTVRWG